MAVLEYSVDQYLVYKIAIDNKFRKRKYWVLSIQIKGFYLIEWGIYFLNKKLRTKSL